MHNNSPEHMPILHAPIQARPKLEGGKRFVMQTPFTAAGDQPTAIAELTAGRMTALSLKPSSLPARA